MHFKAFWNLYDENISENENMSELEIIDILANDNDFKITTNPETTAALRDILDNYNTFTRETIDGKHGDTASYLKEQFA